MINNNVNRDYTDLEAVVSVLRPVISANFKVAQSKMSGTLIESDYLHGFLKGMIYGNDLIQDAKEQRVYKDGESVCTIDLTNRLEVGGYKEYQKTRNVDSRSYIKGYIDGGILSYKGLV